MARPRKITKETVQKLEEGFLMGLSDQRGLYLCGYSGKHVIRLLQETQGVFGAKRVT